MRDGTPPANYKTCAVDADSRVGGNTTAICDTGTNSCRGRFSGLACTPTLCDAGAPS